MYTVYCFDADICLLVAFTGVSKREIMRDALEILKQHNGPDYIRLQALAKKRRCGVHVLLRVEELPAVGSGFYDLTGTYEVPKTRVKKKKINKKVPKRHKKRQNSSRLPPLPDTFEILK